jgi:hypothetical protein
MTVIHSVEEFLETFKVGDQFWFMTFFSGVGPIRIEGPLTIVSFDEADAGHRVYCDGGSDSLPGQRHYVSDITNTYHGVFISETDARSHLEERKQAYQTDPKLIAELIADRQQDALYDERFGGSDPFD